MGGLRPNDEKNVGVRRQTPLGRPKAAKNRPAQRAASNPAGGTLCAGSAFIWRILV
jgi:hypothetical protein